MYKHIERIKTGYIVARSFVIQHRRHLPVVALITGFLLDSLTLNRLDQVFDNLVITFYLVVAGGVIAFLNYKEERMVTPSLWWTVILQFSFGNLASALFVIFGKSGTLVGSWPFLLVFLLLLLGNEFLRGHYTRLRLNIALLSLFVILFSTCYSCTCTCDWSRDFYCKRSLQSYGYGCMVWYFLYGCASSYCRR